MLKKAPEIRSWARRTTSQKGHFCGGFANFGLYLKIFIILVKALKNENFGIKDVFQNKKECIWDIISKKRAICFRNFCQNSGGKSKNVLFSIFPLSTDISEVNCSFLPNNVPNTFFFLLKDVFYAKVFIFKSFYQNSKNFWVQTKICIPPPRNRHFWGGFDMFVTWFQVFSSAC